MKKTFYFLGFLLISLSALFATTVIEPTFEQLVGQAELIFKGTVTNVRSQWTGEGAQRHIVSYVTFKVEDAVKGEPGATYVMQMLGGTVDGETMEVAEAPKFQAGDHDFVFIEQNGKQFVPLVGIMHGRFRIERDQAGHEFVVTNTGKALRDVARLGKATNFVASEETAALSPDQFKSAIRASLQSAAAKKQP